MKKENSILTRAYTLSPLRDLKTSVEDRRIFQFDHCELNVFETREIAQNYHLRFADMSITAMIRGKKIMKLFNQPGFNYLPGEMVLVPGGEDMIIDFPEASQDTPSQCIALTVEDELLKETIHQLNDKMPKTELNESWKIDLQNFHIAASNETNDTLERLYLINKNADTKTRNLLATLTLKELIVRLMQTQARSTILENSSSKAGWHRFAYVMEHIKSNITEKIKVETLCAIACMSKANFFKAFKREFGISPVDMIIKERIKLAKRLLTEENKSITEVCYLSGFNNMSHFFRLFRKEEGITPGSFKDGLLN